MLLINRFVCIPDTEELRTYSIGSRGLSILTYWVPMISIAEKRETWSFPMNSCPRCINLTIRLYFTLRDILDCRWNGSMTSMASHHVHLCSHRDITSHLVLTAGSRWVLYSQRFNILISVYLPISWSGAQCGHSMTSKWVKTLLLASLGVWWDKCGLNQRSNPPVGAQASALWSCCADPHCPLSRGKHLIVGLV